jgi:hypothetical protein
MPAILYSAGRFGWHLQKTALIARRDRKRPISNLALRVWVDWPVPAGLMLLVVIVAIIVLIVELLPSQLVLR